MQRQVQRKHPTCLLAHYSIFVALPSSASVMVADGLAGIRDEIIRSLYASLDYRLGYFIMIA